MCLHKCVYLYISCTLSSFFSSFHSSFLPSFLLSLLSLSVCLFYSGLFIFLLACLISKTKEKEEVDLKV